MKRFGGALESRLNARRHRELLLRPGYRRGRLAERHPRRKIEGDRGDRELALVVHRQRPGPGLEMGKSAEWHRSVRAWEIDVLQPDRRPLELRRGLEHHMVLVELGEQSRDLSLAEGVVERVVDHLRGNPEPRGGYPIDHQRGPQGLVLLIVRHAPKLGERPYPVGELRGPGGELVRIL